MPVLDQFVRWYFGVASRVETSEATWGLRGEPPGDAGPLVVGTGIGLAILLVVWLYRQEGKHLSRQARLVLIALRTAALLLLVAMLFQIRLVLVQYGQPLLAVMFDTSASMSLADDYPERDRRRLSQMMATEIDSQPRMDLVRTALLADDARFLRELARRYELDFYTFDDDATPLLRGAGVPPLEEIIPILDGLPADGSHTNPRRSLQQVLDAYRGTPPLGVVVITDGNATEPEQGRLSIGARRARDVRSPLYVVGVGSGEAASDVAIQQVRSESVAFAEAPLNVDVVISGTAVDGQQTEVHIVPKGEETLLDSRTIELPRNEGTVRLSLEIPRIEPGRNEFEVRVDPLPGESDLSNNQRTIRVWGRTSGLAMLFVERTPRWEFRHLKTALERDQNVELRTFLLDSDVAYAVEDRTAISRLPTTAEDMSEFDAVLLGDVTWESLDPKFVELLPQFIAEEGGGLLWMPGPQRRLFQDVPPALRPLLPIELADLLKPAPGDMLPWSLRRTPEGRGHPLLSTRHNGEVDWDSLPALYALPPSGNIKEGSLVLLEGLPQNRTRSATGARTARDHAARSPEAPQPMLVVMRYGAGQVLLQGVDETWRWRPLQNGTWYRQFWSQAVRFLAQRRIIEQLPAWELVTDRDEYMADETVHLRLLVHHPHAFHLDSPRVLINSTERAGAVSPRPEEDPPPEARREAAPEVEQGNTASAGTRGGSENGIPSPPPVSSRFVRMAPSERTPHAFETSLSDLLPGHYSATLESGLADGPHAQPAFVAAQWRVIGIDRERKYRGMDRADLQRAARVSGGGFYELWELDRLRDELPLPGHGSGHWGRRQATEIPLWNRPEAILLVTLLLLSEWGLRRRRGLE